MTDLNKEYYLSIDCATRSLAIGFYSCDSKFKDKLSEVSNISLDLDNVEVLPELISIYFLKVIDLTDGQKVTDVDALTKCRSLKNHISKIKELVKSVTTNPYNILIEYQMNVNDKSRAVYNMLVYAFCDCGEVITMPPALKNTIYLHKALKYSEVISSSSTNYQANKNHSTYNFIYYLLVFGQLKMIKDIKKKNYDDIADTFTQFIAYIIKKN